MSNQSEQIAEGILKALVALSVPVLIVSVLLGYPIFSIAIICFAIFISGLVFAYKWLNAHFGRVVDLLICAVFLFITRYFFVNDGERIPGHYNGWFVALGWASLLIGISFFNSFRSKRPQEKS